MVAEGNKEFTLFVTINLQVLSVQIYKRNGPVFFLDFCSIFRHNKVHNMKPFDIVTLTVNPALDKSILKVLLLSKNLLKNRVLMLEAESMSQSDFRWEELRKQY
jgi:hypothetical protein